MCVSMIDLPIRRADERIKGAPLALFFGADIKFISQSLITVDANFQAQK